MAREFRGKIPRVPIDADTSRADQKIDRLFNKVKGLQHIEVDADISQAQRRLETLVKRNNSQLSSALVGTMLKDFKTVLGAMKTEFESFGDVSDIYKSLEKTCNMVEDRFSNLTISVNTKQISGLTEILNTVTELQSIDNFSFGEIVSKQAVANADSVLSNIKATKKEINSIVSKIDYIQKTLNKNTDKSFSTEKLQQYKDKLHELRGMLKGFYSIDDDLIQNALVNAAAKINETLGQIDIRMPKSKSTTEIISTGETVKGLSKVKKEVEETAGAYKSLNDIVEETKKKILDKEFDDIFSKTTVEGYAEALTRVRSKMAEIKDEAHDARQEYEDINNTILAYTGAHLGNKTAFQKAIKDAWSNGDHAMAAKLFAGYQEKFPTGKYDPAKQFGTEWSDNFSKNLEEANRNLSYFRTQLKRAAVEYGTFSAFVTLQGYENRLDMGYNRVLEERTTAEQKAAESAKALEKAQQDFATNDLTTAQNNLNKAIDEYNARLSESNRLLAEKRRLEDLESYEGEPWYTANEPPANHIIENARMFAEAEDAVDQYKIALKEAVRVYRELGGDMKLPFSDEALLKEIDIPVKAFLPQGRNNIMSHEEASKWSLYADIDFNRSAEDTKYLEEHGLEVLDGLKARIEALKASLQSVDKIVSRISKNSSAKGMSFEKIRHEAAETAKALSTMYEDGIRDTEEYVALQYKLIHILDAIGKSYGGVKGVGGKDTNDVRLAAMDGVFGETGYNINASDAIDALWGGGKFSIFENTTNLKTMLELAGELSNYQGMEMFSGGFAAQYDKLELKRLQSAVKIIEEIVSGFDVAQDKIKETSELIGRLHTTYADKFDSIFGKTINSFGALDFTNAEQMYDALIAKEQEYKLEIQKRMEALGAFTTNVNNSFQQYAQLEGFISKVTELSNQLVGGGIGLEDANKQLQAFVENATAAISNSVKYVPVLPNGKESVWGDTDDITQARNYVHGQNGGFNVGTRLSVIGAEEIQNAKELDDITKQYNERRQQTQAILNKEKLTLEEIKYLLKEYNQMYWSKLSNPRLAADAVNLEADIESKFGRAKTDFAWDEYLYRGQFAALQNPEVHESVFDSVANTIANKFGIEVPKAINNTIEAERQLAEAAQETTNILEQQKLAVGNTESSFGKDTLKGLKINDFLKQWNISSKERDPIKQEIYRLAELYKDTWTDESGSSGAQFSEQYEKVIGMLNGACNAGEAVHEVYSDFYEWMKNRKFSYDPDDANYAQEFKDNWGQIRKTYSHWLVSSKKDKSASHVDAFYAEAASLFPELFSDDVTNHYDQMKVLLKTIDAARIEQKSSGIVKTDEIEAALTEAFGHDIFDPMVRIVTDIVAEIKSSASKARSEIESAASGNRDLLGNKIGTSDVSVEEIISRDVNRALEQLRSAKNNETTLFTLKGVFDGEDLVDQAQAMVQNIAKQANLSVATFNVKDDIIKVKLYNDELKVTVDQMYRLRQATEDMDSAQLELFSQSFTQNVKALNENNFDVEGVQQRALASIEKVRSSLHGLEYDLTGLESAAKNISSQDDFTKFNNQLKAAQDNIQAIKNATVSKSSMNPLANMQRDMQNASIEIETMRLKLEKFGDIQGVAEAKTMLEEMAAAARQYSEATNAQGQQNAYNQYSNLRSSFKAQTDYISAAKTLNDSQESASKKANPVKEQYQSILELVNKINTANERMIKFQQMDGGTGLLGKQIQGEVDKKAEAVENLKVVMSELQIGNVLGKDQYTLPEDIQSIGADYSQISAFINDAGVQASLTKTEIDKLVNALIKAGDIDLSMLGEMFGSTSIKERAKQIQKENQYFSDKTQFTDTLNIDDIQKLGTAGSTVKEQLEGLAQTIATNSDGAIALTKNFSQSADGIARLDFSVFDKNTNSLRDFRIELGTATGQIGVTETTVNKALAGIQAAQRQVQSTGNLIGKLDASGVSIDEGTATAQVSKLLNLYKQLSAEIAKGDAADQNTITKLTSDLKMASSETEKLYKQMTQMEGAIANGGAIGLGAINPNGDIYGQLVGKAKEFAETQGGATLEIGRFDGATNTLNASLVRAHGSVENFKVSMYGLRGECAAQQAGVGKLTDSWDRFKVGISQVGKQLITAFVGYNVFYKAISEVRKGVGYVKEIDLALTELKKVTNETEESYRKFLNTAAGTAGEIGSTLSDFTEATANFARLNI